MKSNISRRDFLKGSAMGALGLAAAGLVSPVSAMAEEKKEAFEKTVLERGDSIAADQAFHSGIVQAMHNDFMAQFIPGIQRSISQSAALQDGVNWFSGETVEDHRLILSFLRIRDQEGAEAAMRLHLVHIINRLNLPDDGEPVL